MGERRIRLGGETLDDLYHACAFFRSRDEEYDVLTPFVREGLAAGEKAIHIVDPSLRDDHLRRLAAAGVDLAAGVRGQLAVLRWEETYIREGAFNPDSMLELLEQALADCYAQGYRYVRLIGHMEWSLERRPGVERLFEYEARANDVIARHRQPAVCVYDPHQFDARTMLEVLRTHPLVILGGVLRRNPFFVPPADYLRQLEPRTLVA